MTDTEISSTPPAYNTGQLRYDFQIACVRKHPGIVLNVGCNEDPVGLKRRWEDRVINCDMEGWDKYMKRPNIVDRIFNALDTPWPFDPDDAELVVLGDILEHFPVHESIRVAAEAARIAPKVCITVPEDTRIDEAEEHAKWDEEKYNLHTTVVSREKLDAIFAGAKLRPVWLVVGGWGFPDETGTKEIQGFCVLAERIPPPPVGVAMTSAEAGEPVEVELSGEFATGGLVEPIPVGALGAH